MIAKIGGGSAGIVAVAYAGAGVWTSVDGRTWRRTALSGGVFANALVDDATAVSGSFVLGGTTGTVDCVTTMGPEPKPVAKTVSAWWSPDGARWTKAPLPRPVTTTDHQEVWVGRLNDHAALLVDDVFTVSGVTGSVVNRFAWGSTDGRAWASIDVPKDIDQGDIVSAGGQNLIVKPVTSDTSAPAGLSLRTIGDGFAVVSIDQGGDVPSLAYQLPWGGPTYGLVAVGPTGVIVTSADGSQLWFGQPSV